LMETMYTDPAYVQFMAAQTNVNSYYWYIFFNVSGSPPRPQSRPREPPSFTLVVRRDPAPEYGTAAFLRVLPVGELAEPIVAGTVLPFVNRIQTPLGGTTNAALNLSHIEMRNVDVSNNGDEIGIGLLDGEKVWAVLSLKAELRAGALPLRAVFDAIADLQAVYEKRPGRPSLLLPVLFVNRGGRSWFSFVAFDAPRPPAPVSLSSAQPPSFSLVTRLSAPAAKPMSMSTLSRPIDLGTSGLAFSPSYLTKLGEASFADMEGGFIELHHITDDYRVGMGLLDGDEDEAEIKAVVMLPGQQRSGKLPLRMVHETIADMRTAYERRTARDSKNLHVVLFVNRGGARSWYTFVSFESRSLGASFGKEHAGRLLERVGTEGYRIEGVCTADHFHPLDTLVHYLEEEALDQGRLCPFAK
jgi:hypothetical protein